MKSNEVRDEVGISNIIAYVITVQIRLFVRKFFLPRVFFYIPTVSYYSTNAMLSYIMDTNIRVRDTVNKYAQDIDCLIEMFMYFIYITT